MIPGSVRLWVGAALCGLVCATASLRAGGGGAAPVEPLEPGPRWIRPSGDVVQAALFKRSVAVAGPARNAWIRVAAQDGFELLVNGNPIARSYVWRPTRAFQAGNSESGQVLSPGAAVRVPNFPRDYQWEGPGNHQLPIFVDLTPHLEAGRNVIALSVESRASPARVCIEGAIETAAGTLSISSDTDWLARKPGPGDGDWSWTERSGHADPSGSWDAAVASDPAPQPGYRRLDPEMFSSPFEATWMRHAQPVGAGSVWYESAWSIEGPIREAWIRVLANRPFDLFVNGTLVRVASPQDSSLESGEWIFGTQRAEDLPSMPELLDPDEVGELFVGERFESPRRGRGLESTAPARGGWGRAMDATRVATPGELLPGGDPTDRGVVNDGPDGRMEKRMPLSLGRSRGQESLTMFGIGALLRRGDNRISLRLSQHPDGTDSNGEPRLALDARVRAEGGGSSVLESGLGWTSRLHGEDVARSVQTLHPAQRRSATPVQKQFRGEALSPARSALRWARSAGLGVLGGLLALAWMLSMRRALAWTRGRAPGSGWEPTLSILAWTPVFLWAFFLAMTWTWGERSEVLWTHRGALWMGCLWGSLLIACCAAAAMRAADRADPLRPGLCSRAFSHAPRARLWPFLVTWTLLLCAFLRVHQLDLQPLDDDEYASAQAILSIARSGVPALVPDGIWYTRSPLYHYLTAAVVRVFGEHLWALRLPSAFFGVATGLLVYLCGARLLRKPWVGLGALLLFAIHPYVVFTGHVARFYQQQQFFALLTVYCLCRGFVIAGGARAGLYRALTLFAWLCAVLSMEISVLLAPQILLVSLLFNRRGKFPWSPRLIATGVCISVLIVLDYAVFVTRTLTGLEGISPVVQTSISPHFQEPYNFLFLFIGASRLHLLLSAFFFLGLVDALARRRRVALALYFTVLSGVALTNLFVTHTGVRYQYWLIPLWILLGTWGLARVASRLASFVLPAGAMIARRPGLAATYAAAAFLCVVASWSPWRLARSYDATLLGDASGPLPTCARTRARRIGSSPPNRIRTRECSRWVGQTATSPFPCSTTMRCTTRGG